MVKRAETGNIQNWEPSRVQENERPKASIELEVKLK